MSFDNSVTLSKFTKYTIDLDGNIYVKETGNLLNKTVNRVQGRLVKLHNDTGRCTPCYISDLLLSTFKEDLSKTHYARHINGNVFDDNLDNLEWVEGKRPRTLNKNKQDLKVNIEVIGVDEPVLRKFVSYADAYKFAMHLYKTDLDEAKRRVDFSIRKGVGFASHGYMWIKQD